MELYADRRGEKQNDIQGIGKPLLPAIVSNLNFLSDSGAVGITMMKQEFPGSVPSRVKIGQRPRSRDRRRGDCVDVLRNAAPIEIHACRKDKQYEEKSRAFGCRSGHSGMFLANRILSQERKQTRHGQSG